ncbi:hypothetical protein GE09DRAFT_1224651 [Coniochaeta sp. 2T2.1]|nr:hypothetical protein GE09DRAFT_1224651 [Coniochaeta sp. 2T2.1]
MAFGSSIDTLLEVYANCISLLNAFKRRSEGSTSRKDEQDSKQVQLRHSLKSDRARVQRAYSSAVSGAGSRFERGDDRARSALSRVLRKLKAAITNILRSASGHQENQVLDYQSLMLLSNASRSETIRTFDRLSRRLGRSESRITVVTNSSSGRKKRRSGGSSSSGSTAWGKSTGSSRSSSSSRGKDGLLKKRTASPGQKDGKRRTSDWETKVKQPKKTGSTPSSSQPKQTPTRPQHAKQTDRVPPLRTPTLHRRSSPTQPPAAVLNRISLASIVTDSTKLGEIPERKWTSTRLQRRRGSDDSTLDEDGYYNVSPVFPLTRYESPVKERRFLGLFRRRS